MGEQEVFSDQGDGYEEPTYYNNQPYDQWRKPTENEREALTIVVIAQAKNAYNLRNRIVNVEQGTPRSAFIKDQNYKKNNTKSSVKELEKGGKSKMKENPQNQEKENIKTEKNDQTMAHSFDIAHAISQVKILVPLLEMMKIDKYMNTIVKLISNIPSQKHKGSENRTNNVHQETFQMHEVYLSDTLTKNPSQVDPFYTTLLIKK